MTQDSKSSAELEREVQQQRSRVEQRIGEIKDRLSPGQLLDEALSYTKHGGANFASNFGQQVSANPIPATLIGIGVAWLMSSNINGNAQAATSAADHGEYGDYPYASITGGGIRRISHKADEAGQWWSEFETGAGRRYKAKSNSLGERAGHFTDEAGKMFSGFIDDAGNRVREFQDEAGNRLGDARGWANHSWRDVQQSIGDGLNSVGTAAKQAMSGVTSGSRQLGGTVQTQTDQLTRQIANLFDQQPLIAGALAFAAGAALGAALPHTDQEDQLVGKHGDKLRKQAGSAAGKLYEEGKGRVGEMYDEASGKAGEIYDDAKERVAEIGRPAGGVGVTSNSRH